MMMLTTVMSAGDQPDRAGGLLVQMREQAPVLEVNRPEYGER